MKYNGTAILFRLDGVTLMQCKDVSLDIKQDLPEATTKDDSGWKTNINGLRSASLKFSGIADFSSNANIDVLTDMIFDRADAAFQFFPQTNTNVYFYGNVDCGGVTIAAPVEGIVSVEGTMEVNGTLTKGAVANSNA